MRTESSTSILFSCNVAFHFSIFGNLKETVDAGVVTNLIIFLNLCIGIHIYECASFYLSTCIPIYQFLNPYICPSAVRLSHLSGCLSIYLYVCLSVCQSVCSIISLYLYLFF